MKKNYQISTKKVRFDHKNTGTRSIHTSSTHCSMNSSVKELVYNEPKSKWSSKESLIVLSVILIILFKLMQFIFSEIWSGYILAFQVLSGVIFLTLLILTIVGLWFIILSRKRLWSHEREGIALFIIGGLIMVLLPLIGAVFRQKPETFFNYNINFYMIIIGTILVLVGVIIVAWQGGFFSIWFLGIVNYLVFSSHEAFLIIIYTHHYGPYDQYYGTMGILLMFVSVILFLYHELKFMYLGRLIKRSNNLRQKGSYDKALKLIEKALSIYPRYETAWNNKGNVLNAKGKVKESLKCYDEAININPKYIMAWYNKGMMLFEHKRYQEAIICYNKVIGLKPDNRIAWYNKGIALNKLGEYKKAIMCFNKVIEMNPKFEAVWFNKGQSLYSMGKSRKAAKCFDKAIEINPTNGNSWYNKGSVLSTQGRYGEAIECYNNAMTSVHSRNRIVFDKGNVLFNLSR